MQKTKKRLRKAKSPNSLPQFGSTQLGGKLRNQAKQKNHYQAKRKIAELSEAKKALSSEAKIMRDTAERNRQEKSPAMLPLINGKTQGSTEYLLLISGVVLVIAIALIVGINSIGGAKNQLTEAGEEKTSSLDIGYRLIGEQGKFRAIIDMPVSAQTRENFSPKGSAVGGTMPYSYKWTTKNDCIISEPNSETTTINCPTQGKKIIELSVTDSAKTIAATTKSINITRILTSIELSANKNSIKETETTQLTTTAHYNEGPDEDITNKTTYSTNPTDKITIDSSGKATAVAIGSTKITADYSAKKSTPVQITVQQLPMPSSPTNLQAFGNDRSINLTWQANPDDLISSFKAYYLDGPTYLNDPTKLTNCTGTAPNNQCTIKTTIPGSDRSASISGLSNGTKYYAAITTLNKNNSQESPKSETVTATPSLNLPPIVAFDFAPTNPQIIGNNPAMVSFTNKSTDTPGDTITYNWNFGDEENSTEQNPTHSYTTEGQKMVTLKATDSKQSSNSISKPIIIEKIVIPEDLVLFYDFENQTGTTINDKSLYANHGAINGIPAIESTSNPLFPNSNYIDFGNPNNSNYINVTESASAKLTNLSNYTISAWVFPTSSNQQSILGKGSGFTLGTQTPNIFFPNTTTIKNGNLVNNKWNHTAIVRNGSTINYYANYTSGIAPQTQTSTISTGVLPLLIASSLTANLQKFNGKMDEIKIFNSIKDSTIIEQEFLKYGLIGLKMFQGTTEPLTEINETQEFATTKGQEIPLTVKFSLITGEKRAISAQKITWNATGNLSINTPGTKTLSNASSTIKLIAGDPNTNNSITATYTDGEITKSIVLNIKIKDSLILFYDFDNPNMANNTTCLNEEDKSGSGYNGTLALGTSPLCANARISGEGAVASGKAMQFDGTDDMIQTTITNLTAGTIELWAKPVNYNNRTLTLFAPLWNTGYGFNYQISFIDNAKVKAYLFDDTGGKIIASNNSYTINKWQQVALTWKDGSNFQLFLNGKKEAEAPIGTSQKIANFSIGQPGRAFPYENYFQGMVDEVKIHMAQLTAEQIKNDFYSKYIRNIYGIESSNGQNNVEVGKTLQLQLQADTMNGTENIANYATWSSDKPAKATVDSTGKATGIAETSLGETVKITATIIKNGTPESKSIDITVKLPSTILYYDFDNPLDTGCIETDKGDYANNGDLLGFTSPNTCSQARTIIAGTEKAINFTGWDKIRTQKMDLSGSITISFWIKPNAVYNGGTIMDNKVFNISISQPGTIGYSYSTSTNGFWLTSAKQLQTNQWNFITIVNDATSNTGSIYINGKIDKSAPLTGTILPTTCQTILGSLRGLGSGGCLPITIPEPYNGLFDELKIIKKASTQAEITEEMGVSTNPTITPTSSTLTPGTTVILALKQSFNGREVNRTSEASWTNSNPNAVTFDKTTGIAKGIAVGTATLTAVYETFPAVSAAITVTSIPSTPTNVWARPGYAYSSANDTIISWNAVPGATKYRVQYLVCSGNTCRGYGYMYGYDYTVPEITNTSYTLTLPSYSFLDKIGVSACNTMGCSGYSTAYCTNNGCAS